MKDEERKNGSCPEEEGAESDHSGDEVKQTVDDFGAIRNVFRFDTDIQYLTIIGSVEGHMVLPQQNKTT